MHFMQNKKIFFISLIGIVALICLSAWLRGCGGEIKSRLHNEQKPFNALAYLISKNNKEAANYLQAHKRDSLITDSIYKLKRIAEARYKRSSALVRAGFTKNYCDTTYTKAALDDCDSLSEQNNRVIASKDKELTDYAGAVGKLLEGQTMRDARHVQDSTDYAKLYAKADTMQNITIPGLERKAKRNFKLGAAAGVVVGASAGYGAGKVLP